MRMMFKKSKIVEILNFNFNYEIAYRDIVHFDGHCVS